MSDSIDLTVMIVGTRGYFKLAERLINQLRRFKDRSVQFIVLTEKPRPDADCEICIVPDYDWPELALRRYEMLLTAMPQALGKRVAMLDADTSIPPAAGSPFPLLTCEAKPLFAVQHWDSTEISGVPAPYCGDWRSASHISHTQGQESDGLYVQGAALGGEREAFTKLLQRLDAGLCTDRTHNVVATWHDESHWNKYVFHNRKDVLIFPLFAWRSHFCPSDKGTETMDQLRRPPGGYQ